MNIWLRRIESFAQRSEAGCCLADSEKATLAEIAHRLDFAIIYEATARLALPSLLHSSRLDRPKPPACSTPAVSPLLRLGALPGTVGLLCPTLWAAYLLDYPNLVAVKAQHLWPAPPHEGRSSADQDKASQSTFSAAGQVEPGK